MNFSQPASVKFNVHDLIRAITQNSAYDALTCALSGAQWELLVSYMQPFALTQGQVLIEQGALDRTLYLVESGTLSVHYEDEDGSMKLAILNPGAVVGEGAFFSRQPRSASVVGTGPGKLWCLTPLRFTEMANRQPALALELAMGLGGVIAKRLSHKPKRVTVT